MAVKFSVSGALQVLARLRRRVKKQLEAWGYGAFAVAFMVGFPWFFYHLSSTAPALSDIERVTAAVRAQRVFVDRSGEADELYLEVSLQGLALPVRFHEPVMGLDGSAALNGPAFAASKPARATVTIDRRDRAKLASPPDYLPHRWIEGYGLEADGKVYLPVETGVEYWRRDRRGLRYFAHAVVFLEAGLILSAFLLLRDSSRPGARSAALLEPPMRSAQEELAEMKAARRESTFYYVLLPGLLLFNVAALFLCNYSQWDFGPRYWLLFAAAIAALQTLFFVHHRRRLSILDSLPRSVGEAPGGFLSYLVLTVMLCVMLTPALQALYFFLAR